MGLEFGFGFGFGVLLRLLFVVGGVWWLVYVVFDGVDEMRSRRRLFRI